MAISQANAINEIAQALAGNNDRVLWDKGQIASMVAGTYASYWRIASIPSAGAIPAAAAYCTKALAGSLSFTNQTAPITGYFAWAIAAMNAASSNCEIVDRIAHMGGLSGTPLTAQTVGIDLSTINAGGPVAAARLGASDYSDIQWFLEWYTATGATASNATVNVTYNDGSTGNLAAIAIGGTAVIASRTLVLQPAATGLWIRAVNSVTLSASTGTAGSFGVTAQRSRCTFTESLVNMQTPYDWAQLGIPEIPADSCLALVSFNTGTIAPALRGYGKIIHV